MLAGMAVTQRQHHRERAMHSVSCEPIFQSVAFAGFVIPASDDGHFGRQDYKYEPPRENAFDHRLCLRSNTSSRAHLDKVGDRRFQPN